MNTPKQALRNILFALLLTLPLASGTPALAGSLPALDSVIKAWADETKVPSYKYALVDLNDDGVDDAVVLITEQDYCGSGGCSLVIFRGVAGSFEIVSSSTITREPILLLPEKCHGWHTLSVLIAGGGVKPGQVIMRFNGTKYPYNPGMQPKANNNELKGAKTLMLRQCD
jgi:hypothetical protein